MVLRKLTISGFKSFANKTEVEFDQGVTAIIGPNGCGKSNISDAIRWVLGEHNPRRLRGQGMQDMIFNGTANRPAAGMAEVSLLFDNRDGILPVPYREVLVSRRLYRSGDSEYLLNKTKCRLKDVTDLFLDSGIGTNAYSLMEQGRVDMIVNAKPMERRQIIEEAAGVSRFLSRKVEAIRKLERTDSDLQRLQDILSELQRQKRSLERQAKQAELAQRYRKELLQAEYALHMRSGSQLTTNRDDLDQKLKSLQERIAVIEQEVAETRRKKHELTEQLQQLDEKNRSQRDHYATSNARLEQMEVQVKSLSERVNEYAQLKTRLLGEIEADTRRMNEERERIAEAESRIETLSMELVQLEEQSEQLTKQYQEASRKFAEVEGEEKKRRSTFLNVEKDISDLKNLQRIWERDREFYTGRLNQLRKEHEEVLKEIDAHQRRVNELTAETTEVQEQLEQVRKRHEELVAQLKQLNQDDAQCRNDLRQCERQWQQVHSRWESLCELQARLEGFDEGVRYLLRDKQEERIPSLICTLAERIQVKQGYERAVEAALAHKLQAVVCENEAAVLQSIERLRERKKGRVAFLPPTHGTPANGQPVPAELQALTPAESLIHTEDSLRPLIQRLTHHAYVVDSFQRGLELRDRLPAGARLITREGDVIEGDGAITGGYSRTSQILGRTAEIKQMEEQIQVLDAEKQRLETLSIELRAAIQERSAERDATRQLLMELENRQRVIQDERSRAQKRLQQFEQSDRALAEECNGLTAELEQGAEEAEMRQLKLNEALEKRNRLQAELDTWAEQMQQTRENLSVLQEQLGEQKMLLLEKKKDKERWAGSIESNSRHLRELEHGIEEKRMLAEQQDEKRAETEQAIEETKQTLVNLAQERDSVWQDVQASEEAVQELRSMFRKIEEEESVRVEQYERLRTEREAIDQERMKVQVEQEYWQRKMEEAFANLTEEERTACEQDQRPDEELKEKVEFYRRRLGQLGMVNELAIEEYEEVKLRCDFLEEHFNDLTRAKADLLSSAKELHGTSVKLFLETFEQVKENFNRMFRKIFNGGRADLILMDGDPLEAGIEIEVQPPGKKLQTIGLLSGGEKALVAVALLFAIYEIKPCPFCFLDEIDAPLDEKNIGRFTAMLRNFLDRSQFIIITHNKKTMEICDALYGVTMAQEGISSVYSMKFNQSSIETAPGNGKTNGSHGQNGNSPIPAEVEEEVAV